MACNRCSQKNRTREVENYDLYQVFGNYKYLTDRQLKARLAVYKKGHCSECESIEICDIVLFHKCKNLK